MSKAYIKRDDDQSRHEIHIQLIAASAGGPVSLSIQTNAEEGQLQADPTNVGREHLLVRGEVLTIVIED